MTRVPFGPGTIRIALMAVMFVALTMALIMLQPGPDREFAAPSDRDQVSKSDMTAIDDSPPAPVVVPVQVPVAPLPQPAPLAATVPPAPRSVETPAPELRQMSWGILQQLDAATGRDTAPGDPGSLLHTIVGRAMSDGLSDTGQTEIATRLPRPERPKDDTYVVQPNDTLLVIAQRTYGDPAAFDRIFEANRDQLTRPEDIRVGQVLRLPRR